MGTCDETNVATSKSCKAGYLLADDKCDKKCPENATTCSSETAATACVPGFFKDGDACKTCNKTEKNIAACTEADKATACVTGYRKTGGNTCEKCTKDNTAECTAEAGKSTLFLPGFLLSGDACDKACSAGGAICNAEDSDITCIDGYTFIGGADKKVCEKCTANGAKYCPNALDKAS